MEIMWLASGSCQGLVDGEQCFVGGEVVDRELVGGFSFGVRALKDEQYWTICKQYNTGPLVLQYTSRPIPIQY